MGYLYIMQNKENRKNTAMRNLRKEFYDLYLKDIYPILLKLEKVRLSNMKKLFFCEIIMALSCIILAYLTYKFSTSSSSVLFGFSMLFPIIIFLIIAIMIWLPINFAKKFKTKIKEKCMRRLKKLYNGIVWGEDSQFDVSNGIFLSEDINDYVYGKEKGTASYIFSESKLFADFDKLKFDDTFQGTYNGVKFNVFETEMLYETYYKGRKTLVTVFKGIIVLVPSNKEIKAHTIITTKGDYNIQNKTPLAIIAGLLLYCIDPFSKGEILGGCICLAITAIIAAIKILSDRSKIEKVNLEDLKFDKRFSVFSQDQIEARYLVTPTFMDRLYNLKTAFGTNKIKCAFFDKRILFAISTNKDVFEIGSFFTSLTDGKKVKEFFNEISSIYEMIEYFKLDEKTGI